MEFLSEAAAQGCYNYHVASCIQPSQARPSCSGAPISAEIVGIHDSFESSTDVCTLSVSQTPAANSEDEEVDNPQPSTQEGTSKYKRGGKHKEIWSYEATESLLELVKENDKRLHDRKTKKRDITRSLQHIGLSTIRQHHIKIPGNQVKQVELEWRTLKARYRVYQDHKTATGRKSEPPHYDLLSSILQHRPLSTPSLCVLEGTAENEVATVEVDPENPPLPAEEGSDVPTTSAAPVVSPQPTPATHAVKVVPPQATRPAATSGPTPAPPRRTRRTVRPSNERMEMLHCLKNMEQTLKNSIQNQSNHFEEMREMIRGIAARDRERHELELQIRRESHELDMETKRERLQILKLKRLELERRNQV